VWLWCWKRAAASVRSATPAGDGPVHDALLRVATKAGLRVRVHLVLSNRNIEPGVYGLWHPTLVWPRRLTGCVTPEQLDAIVAHEVFHVVRRDNLLAVAQTIVCAVFWFHPLVWWLAARLVEERERACDEHVVATGQRRAAYAEGLLETCRHCLASPLAAISGVTGGDLTKRVARIMNDEPALGLGLRKRLLLTAAAILVLLAPIASGRSAPRPADLSNRLPLAVQADDQEEVHRPGGDVSSPRLLREVKPQYSERAKAEKIQGEVTMECVVKTDGTVGRIEVTKSLDPDLDQAAIDAARQWRFEPGTRKGKPVNVLVTILIAFTLK
jgi:TonB family protein